MAGLALPKPSLVAPAALYLTAVLECVCECVFPLSSICPVLSDPANPRHILSIVGRVASRDSSRTYATVHDLFVALCEDDSMYGLFKTMKGAPDYSHFPI
jgi:hypothetical protein